MCENFICGQILISRAAIEHWLAFTFVPLPLSAFCFPPYHFIPSPPHIDTYYQNKDNDMLSDSKPDLAKVPNSEETMELPMQNRTFPCKTLITSMQLDRPYPTKTVTVPYGKGLIATQYCPPGTILEKFEGLVVEYSELGSDDLPLALNFLDKDKQWKWLLANTPAIYANHCCSPNAQLTDNQEIEAIRPIHQGEEVGFIYSRGTAEEKWDPAWTFFCQCGAKNCQGWINGYKPWESAC
jgi:hypothetical protein